LPKAFARLLIGERRRQAITRSENVVCIETDISMKGLVSRYCECCHGQAFRAHQHMAILNGASQDYNFEPDEPESLQEPTTLRWTMRSMAVPALAASEHTVTDKITGYAFGLKPAPVRHDRNYRADLNLRSKLREEARHDAKAFGRLLPDDILARVLRNEDEAAGRMSIARCQVSEIDIAWMRPLASAEPQQAWSGPWGRTTSPKEWAPRSSPRSTLATLPLLASNRSRACG
jgi:hypothetical protein